MRTFYDILYYDRRPQYFRRRCIAAKLEYDGRSEMELLLPYTPFLRLDAPMHINMRNRVYFPYTLYGHNKSELLS